MSYSTPAQSITPLAPLAYAIGYPAPVAIDIAVDGILGELPAIVDNAALRALFSQSEIITRLELRTPIFRQTARDGHFGINRLPWERPFDLDGLIAAASWLAGTRGSSSNA